MHTNSQVNFNKMQSPTGLSVVSDTRLFICHIFFGTPFTPDGIMGMTDIFGTLNPPNPPSSSLSRFLSLFGFHVFSFCSSQSHPAFLSCRGFSTPRLFSSSVGGTEQCGGNRLPLHASLHRRASSFISLSTACPSSSLFFYLHVPLPLSIAYHRYPSLP